MLFEGQAFFNRIFGKRQFLQRVVAKLGSPPQKGKPVALMAGAGKVPQPVAQIGYQEFVQLHAAQIPWGRFLYLLNNTGCRKLPEISFVLGLCRDLE